MPKLKTKKAAAKRFRKTSTGKFKYPKAGKQHYTGPKTSKIKMKMRKMGVVDKTNEKAVRKMLPYA